MAGIQPPEHHESGHDADFGRNKHPILLPSRTIRASATALVIPIGARPGVSFQVGTATVVEAESFLRLMPLNHLRPYSPFCLKFLALEVRIAASRQPPKLSSKSPFSSSVIELARVDAFCRFHAAWNWNGFEIAVASA